MGLGDSAVDTFFRVYRQIQAEQEEKRKMGDMFSIDNDEVQRRMDELTQDELRRLGYVDAEPPALIVPLAAQTPDSTSEEPVPTLASYRGAPDAQRPAQTLSWWRRALRWLGGR